MDSGEVGFVWWTLADEPSWSFGCEGARATGDIVVPDFGDGCFSFTAVFAVT